MKQFSLKDLVKDNKQVHFLFYRKGEMWYRTDDGFEFPVPVQDSGDAQFLAQDRAILFMRYIRQHLQDIEKGKEECGLGQGVGVGMEHAP